jgi:nicotinamidase-related amidase
MLKYQMKERLKGGSISLNAKRSSALVIIDPQNDFCDPGGSLYVDGANEDIIRLAAHIGCSAADYSDVFVSLDSHDVTAVFHPKFWIDASGNSPAPFTQISAEDYSAGKWIAASAEYKFYTDKMFAVMEGKKIPSLMVWPEHCVVSTWGHNIASPLRDALGKWGEVSGRVVRYVFKGENPYTEQFSIFEGIDDSWPETAFNENLFGLLAGFESVTFAGEALSHCVEASVVSYLEHKGNKPRKAGQKVSILSDCTSPVSGFKRSDSEERLRALGVRLVCRAIRA